MKRRASIGPGGIAAAITSAVHHATGVRVRNCRSRSRICEHEVFPLFAAP